MLPSALCQVPVIAYDRPSQAVDPTTAETVVATLGRDRVNRGESTSVFDLAVRTDDVVGRASSIAGGAVPHGYFSVLNVSTQRRLAVPRVTTSNAPPYVGVVPPVPHPEPR